MPSHPKVDFRQCGRHLEKSIWRHKSAADRPITTKFGMQLQKSFRLMGYFFDSHYMLAGVVLVDVV